MPDEQDQAEAFDEESLGSEQATSDMAPIDPVPDRPVGLPFADADITDESMADRADREEPEVWETQPVAAEDLDPSDVLDPLERLGGVEIVHDVDLDELPEDLADDA